MSSFFIIKLVTVADSGLLITHVFTTAADLVVGKKA